MGEKWKDFDKISANITGDIWTQPISLHHIVISVYKYYQYQKIAFRWIDKKTPIIYDFLDIILKRHKRKCILCDIDSVSGIIYIYRITWFCIMNDVMICYLRFWVRAKSSSLRRICGNNFHSEKMKKKTRKKFIIVACIVMTNMVSKFPLSSRHISVVLSHWKQFKVKFTRKWHFYFTQKKKRNS